MKKLYGGRSGGGGGSSRRGKVHPSPSPTPTNPDHYLTILAALPAAMLALTTALTTEDREVLAYLISCGGERRTHLEECEKTAARRRRAVGATAEGTPPPPVFGCSCFHCYTSYWARWDASPNRQLIHEIIDALEEGNLRAASRKKAKTTRRGRAAGGAEAGGRGGGVAQGTDAEGSERGLDGPHVREGLPDDEEDVAEEDAAEEEEEGEGEERKSPLKRLVNYLGERIWGVWSF